MAVTGPPRDRLEDEPCREVGGDVRGKGPAPAEPSAVGHELVEQPHADSSVEEVTQVGCVAGTSLHGVGRDPGRRDQIEELTHDLIELELDIGLARAPPQRSIERVDPNVANQDPVEPGDQLDPIRRRDRQVATLGDVDEGTLGAEQEERSFPLDVVVERADRDTGHTGHIDHLGRREAGPGEHLGGRIDDREQPFGTPSWWHAITIMNSSF